MQITLSQLKEIAKAGYKESKVMFHKLDEFEFCPSVMAKIQDCHVYYVDKNGYSRTILRILYRDKKTVSIYENTRTFNTIAAIRKMEELGLIEKYRRP